MVTAFSPHIPAENYRAFRCQFGAGLPDTFEKWRGVLLDKQASYSAHKWESGFQVIDVEIDAAEFASYLRATRTKATPESIFRFAEEKGSRQTD